MNLREEAWTLEAAIAAVLESAALPHERTLGMELVAAALFERIDGVLRGASVAALAAWLDETYSRYGDVPCLNAVLRATLREASPYAGAAGDNAALASVAAAIDDASRRQPGESGAHEPLDEIDACLGDLLNRLFDHDPITAEHSRAVSSWCARVARKLGFSQADTLLVKRAGLVHDVGKIGTPEAILNAARGLSPDEWEIMRRHTTDGAEIVADVPLLADFVPAIRGHHERLDGKGYPDGLRGEAIPLSARVVAVADCFNAMIGRRPYRPPMAPYRALEQLQRSAGSHLDPDVVDAMVSVVAG